MNNETCVGCLTNIRDVFVVGSKQCEGEALKYQQNFISALNYAIELINDTENSKVEWMPVSDGLPNLSDRYLVTTRYDEIMTDFFTGDHFLQGDDIIAWQPLPQAYKEGGAK